MDFGAAVSQRGYDVKTAADRFLVYSSAFRTLKILATYSVTGTTPRDNNATFTANAGTDTLTSAGHGLNNDELINFTSSGTLPGGIGSFDDGFFYYVVNKTTNTFQISLTPGGSVIDITSAGSGTHDWWTDVSKVLITHNLGYFSPWIFVYNGTASSGGTSAFMSDGLFPLNIRVYENTTEIYIDTGFDDLFSPGTTVYFTCYQFIDTFDTYEADIINTSTSSGAASDDQGFRISKPAFDVLTCSDVDCILSSSFFTSIVQMKGIDTTETVTHDLGYLPSFLAYLKVSGKTYLEQANDRIAITTSALTSLLDTGDSLYYVIFKNKSV